MDIPDDIINAAFFFTAIVGLSSPTISTQEQTKKIKILNESIHDCKTFKNTSKNELIVLPTGDGMAIGFIDGLEQPLELAIELQKKLKDYNQDKPQLEQILIRIGCNVGNVFVVKDVSGNLNYWGPGIILARRTMDLGEPWHILMTADLAESIRELSEKYKKIIHPLHDCMIKHEQTILLYSVFGENFGNKELPEKGLTEEKILEKKTSNLKNKMIFDKAKFKISLKDPTKNLFTYKRTYKFTNLTNEPIYDITTGIMTSVKKNFFELQVKCTDEDKRELEITSINVDKPFLNEFTLKFNQPVLKNEVKEFTLAYQLESQENYFENKFLLNIKSFDISLSFPANAQLKNPKLVYIQNNDRKQIDSDPKIITGVYTIISWSNIHDIYEGDVIRLEWN